MMENIGDDGVGILLFLGLVKLLARFPHQPGTERAEHEELLPGVGLQHKVMPGCCEDYLIKYYLVNTMYSQHHQQPI